jgi:hypothetical protein
MHPCFLPTHHPAICTCNGRSATGTDEGIRSYTSNFSHSGNHHQNKSPRSQNNSLADAIQDWVSQFWRRSFPAAPCKNAPSGSPPLTVWRASG